MPLFQLENNEAYQVQCKLLSISRRFSAQKKAEYRSFYSWMKETAAFDGFIESNNGAWFYNCV